MSGEGEGLENQGANDLNSEEQQTLENSTHGEITGDPTQPVDQNDGEDSAQVTVAEKEGVAEKDDDASIDPKTSITTEEISENPPEEQQSQASQKEDPTDMDEPAMSVVISEPDKDVATQEANAQTEGRESPIGNAGDSADSPGKGDNRVIESQSESDSPLVAPPTSKAEKSIDSEIPAKNATDHPESGGIAKDGFTANGKLNTWFPFWLVNFDLTPTHFSYLAERWTISITARTMTSFPLGSCILLSVGSHLLVNSQLRLLHFKLFDWLKNSDYEPIVRVLRHTENSALSLKIFHTKFSTSALYNGRNKNRRQKPVWEFTKTIISFTLVGHEVIITNSRYVLVGYFITWYPTWAHGIIVI